MGIAAGIASMTYPNVLEEWTTLELLQQGRSIARYGDGELKLCRGASIKCQPYSESLNKRLREILVSDQVDCLVGIPRIAKRHFMTKQKQAMWEPFTGPSYTRFYDQNKIYASAFVTRPDSVPSLYTAEYFEEVKKLFQGRDVILINGDNRKMDKDPTLFEYSKSFGRWEAPAQNAWGKYQGILDSCLGEPKTTLFVLGLGPTATVLAYDLCRAGYQALDLGHIGLFYSRFMAGKPFDFDKKEVSPHGY